MKFHTKLLYPFRWLLARRKRWITALLILGIPSLLVISALSYRGISMVVSRIQYQNDIKQHIEQTRSDLELNEELWNNKGLSDYKFKLEVIYGGYTMWEGFGGISTGGEKVSEIIVEVRDNKVFSITNAEDNQPIDLSSNQYPDTVPELFSIVRCVLDGNTECDTNKLEDNLSDALDFLSYDVSNEIPYSVAADFSESFGFPNTISLYKQRGSSRDYFVINYYITYVVPRFWTL